MHKRKPHENIKHNLFNKADRKYVFRIQVKLKNTHEMIPTILRK